MLHLYIKLLRKHASKLGLLQEKKHFLLFF